MNSSLNKLVSSNGFLLKKIEKCLIPDTMDEFITITEIFKNSHLVGLDIGKQKSGVAVSDNLLNIAVPLKIISTKLISSYLNKFHENIKFKGMIVGMPLTLSGNIGATSVIICNVLNDMSGLINKNKISIWFHDERFTTAYSYSTLKSPKSPMLVDDLCAMKILQEYLDLRKLRSHALNQGK